MNNPFRKQYRITEDVNTSGKSLFYPERTILGFWCRERGIKGDQSYTTYDECNAHMCYNHAETKIIHKVDKVFNKLKNGK